jgi:hypothetical protein
MFIHQRKRRLSASVSTTQPRDQLNEDAEPGADRAVRARLEGVPTQELAESAAAASSLFLSAGTTTTQHGSSTPLALSAIVLSSPVNYNTLSSSRLNESAQSGKKAYPCRFCSMTLSSSSNRIRHERTKHAPSQQQEFTMATSAAAASSFGDHGSSMVNESAVNAETAAAASSDSAAPNSSAALVSSHVPPHHQASVSAASDPTVHFALLRANNMDAYDFSDDASCGSSDSSSDQAAEKSDHAGDANMQRTCSSSAATAVLDDTAVTAAAAAALPIPPAEDLSVAAAAELEPPPQMDLSGVDGISPSLQEEELQRVCYHFLCWLTEPPLTPCEALVKARRIKSLTQLQPIKNTLRFIFVLLHESGSLHVPELSALSSLSLCQQLYNTMQARQVGHARLHAIFLLIKKILVFLSSKESASRKQFLLPSSVSESYLYVDGICSDSSFRRKQEARNRSLLGVAASKQLHRTQAAAAAAAASQSHSDSTHDGLAAVAGQAGHGFRVPQIWSASPAPQMVKAQPGDPKPLQIGVRSSGVHAAPVATTAAAPTAAGPSPTPRTPIAISGKAARSTRKPKPQAAQLGTDSLQPASGALDGHRNTAVASARLSSGDAEVSANEMSSLELQQVTQGCVRFLQQHIICPVVTAPSPQLSAQLPGPIEVEAAAALASASAVEPAALSPLQLELPIASEPSAELSASASAAAAEAIMPAKQLPAVADHVYMAYLVTAILCLCMAPRSQVLRQLKISSSLVKEADGKYWVRMLADMCKNGKPTLFAVPELLTPIMDYYLHIVRPRILARQPQLQNAAHGSAAAAASSGSLHSVAPSHDYFFCKTNGTAPRVEFSTCTSLATMQLIGRPINAHAFRSAVITTFYSANASQADMDTLANIMSHDAATARNYYYRPQHMRAAEDTSQRMMQQLLPAAASE